MIQRQPLSTLTYARFPYWTRFRSDTWGVRKAGGGQPVRVDTHPALENGRNHTGHATRMRIRDTSAQDRPVATATAAGQRALKRRQFLPMGGIGAAVLLLAVWLVIGWAAGSNSFDAGRVRLAQVTSGALVRAISAQGRVRAANTP